MEHLVANLSGKTRRATLNGRNYLVAPLVLITPGVLAGSKGPLLYPDEEVGRDPAIWNHVPLTAGHPTLNGEPVSARSPEVLEKYGIGYVFNATFDGKLKAEGWYDEEATRRIEPRIWSALEANQIIELSTGVFTENVPANNGAAHNGREYIATARNYKGDHVATLIDSVGACSVKDGCGVLVNADQKRTLWQRLGEMLGLSKPTTNAGANEPSHEDLEEKLDGLLKERFAALMKPAMPDMGMGMMNGMEDDCIEAVYDKSVVFCMQDKTWELGYTTDLRTGAVSLSTSQPVEVSKITTYKPVTNEGDQQGDDMTRKENIAWLTANCDCWKGAEADLEKLPDERLAGLKAGAEKVQQTVAVTNTATAPFEAGGQVFTFNAQSGKWESKAKEVLATPPAPAPVNNLTAEQEEDLAFARAEKARQKSVLVDRLVANIADPQAKVTRHAWLMAKPLAELSDLASLLPAAPAQTQQMPPHWGGAAPVYNTVPQRDDSNNLLPEITYNWGEPEPAKTA